MKRDIAITKLNSSFLSYEKDLETILKKLFVTSKPYDEVLKRLLVINTEDCLDNTESEVYKNKLAEMSLAKLKDEGYITITPKIRFNEHEEVKTYIVITMDNFTPTSNPEFRDCTVSFDILCHTDCWEVGNYRIRPLKIAGYIDAILNGTKLSGIGTFQFIGCSEILLSEDLAGYSLIYQATHGSDDVIETQ